MRDARRLLDLVVAKLAATDARLEVFGAPPDDPRLVAVELGAHVRLVAVFAEPVPEPQAMAERLQRLVASFSETAVEQVAEHLDHTMAARDGDAELDLGEALEVLRERAGARAVVIVDERSPEIWGASPAVPWRTVYEACDATPDDEVLAAVARAIERVREGEPAAEGEHVSALLGLYRLIVLEGDAGPLRVEGAVRKARPVLERSLRSLPPRQPPPTRAAIVPLRD